MALLDIDLNDIVNHGWIEKKEGKFTVHLTKAENPKVIGIPDEGESEYELFELAYLLYSGKVEIASGSTIHIINA